MPKEFLRRNTTKYSKLGRKRKKKQKWRNPGGRDNKMREKRRGYPSKVEIGYKKSKEETKALPMTVNNVNDLKKAKGKTVIIGKVGKKKKTEIAEKAKEMKISVQNLNVEKFLKKIKTKEKQKNEPGKEKKS